MGDIQIKYNGAAIPAASRCVLHADSIFYSKHPPVIVPCSYRRLLVTSANRIIYPSKEQESRFLVIYFFGKLSSSCHNFCATPGRKRLAKISPRFPFNFTISRQGKYCCINETFHLLLLFVRRSSRLINFKRARTINYERYTLVLITEFKYQNK